MSKKRRNAVPTAGKTKNQVPTAQQCQCSNNDRVYFTFIYSNWLSSFEEKEFTTFLKNESMYSFQMTYLFGYLIPKISEEWIKKGTTPEFSHCHMVKKEDKSYNKYINTIRHLHPSIDTDSLTIWQLGFKVNSMRLICHKEATRGTFIPLLIDYHHLGNVDKHYNQSDYTSYKFCPWSNYLSK